jgi:2-polyprenyl-3-methyl-5-hydroxy-6-metoxy-1,4-benzoquinol methylase
VANARGKSIDNTYLSLNHATRRGYIHRDYIAHCLRWNHVVKYLRKNNLYKTARILDVGCGRELPLAMTLYTSQLTFVTGRYVGIDHGPINEEALRVFANSQKHEFVQRTDFEDWARKAVVDKRGFDLITCFEVLEHVEADHAFRMLCLMRQLVAESGGEAMISTPVYDPRVGAADNHVSEMSFPLMQAMLGWAGFKIKHVWGTFASKRDYKDRLPVSWRGLFDQLSGYYNTELLAVIFAPLYPEYSRNCLWHVDVGEAPVLTQKMLDPFLKEPEKHSSSSDFVRVFTLKNMVGAKSSAPTRSKTR